MTVPEFRPNAPVLSACRAVGRAMDLFDETACRHLGIGRSDLRALNALEHGPLGAAVLAERLALSRASVTALVDRLERAGYLERTPDPEDRRGIRIALLPATFKAFAQVYRPLGESVHAATAGLPDQEQVVLTRTLTAVAAVFDEQRSRLDASSNA